MIERRDKVLDRNLGLPRSIMCGNERNMNFPNLMIDSMLANIKTNIKRGSMLNSMLTRIDSRIEAILCAIIGLIAQQLRRCNYVSNRAIDWLKIGPNRSSWSNILAIGPEIGPPMGWWTDTDGMPGSMNKDLWR